MNTETKGTTHSFAVIACTVHGDTLCGSGYRGIEASKAAVDERERYHNEGTSKLRCIIVVRADGQTVTLWPNRDHGFVLTDPADRRRFQQWYRDEDGKISAERF